MRWINTKTLLHDLFVHIYSAWEVIGLFIAWLIATDVHGWLWLLSIPFFMAWETVAFIVCRKLGIKF